MNSKNMHILVAEQSLVCNLYCMMMQGEIWTNGVRKLAKINTGDILQLLWDATPMTKECTQADLALITNQLSELMTHYSRRRQATALEQVKKHREQRREM
ncbi:hypothetical protein [Lysinibacillus odysseyi]|uniref:hypothetical protein n=2 Tax=Lysinibacillus odysseyi TaxID=202611 RepID=UPI00117E9497|nr:hypothetical protein [Lysinibacillus odysseyi]